MLPPSATASKIVAWSIFWANFIATIVATRAPASGDTQLLSLNEMAWESVLIALGWYFQPSQMTALKRGETALTPIAAGALLYSLTVPVTIAPEL